ncbi:hypothetical protein A0H81_07424 [Grifola frondosa]|uniref:Uncharacterized protein n=1 Tax=Grifola frondosa TaxID=5627 RepID=A0A1C7M785_GRIFR|nr:hypothetical protein A0H81_07424 [Grifola frondosa]
MSSSLRCICLQGIFCNGIALGQETHRSMHYKDDDESPRDTMPICHMVNPAEALANAQIEGQK